MEKKKTISKKKKKKETKEKDLLNREEKKSAEGYELSFSPFHGRISAVTLFHELAVPSARQPEERKVGRGGEKKKIFFPGWRLAVVNFPSKGWQPLDITSGTMNHGATGTRWDSQP